MPVTPPFFFPHLNDIIRITEFDIIYTFICFKLLLIFLATALIIKCDWYRTHRRGWGSRFQKLTLFQCEMKT